MDRSATAQVHRGAPQRKIRAGHQHFVAVVDQRLHGHYHQFGYAVADVNIFDVYVTNVDLLAVLHHGLARSE